MQTETQMELRSHLKASMGTVVDHKKPTIQLQDSKDCDTETEVSVLSKTKKRRAQHKRASQVCFYIFILFYVSVIDVVHHSVLLDDAGSRKRSS